MIRKNLRRILVIGINLFIIGFLAFTGSITTNLKSEESQLVPDNSLVYDFRLGDYKMTKEADRVVLEAKGKASVYLARTSTRVLSKADVSLNLPLVGSSINLQEESLGIYSLDLAERAIISLDSLLDEANFVPLEFSIDGRRITTASFTSYLRNTNISSVSGSQEFKIPVQISLKGRVLDKTGKPITNKTLSVRVEFPNHNYQEEISVATDSDGLISYQRKEEMIVTVSKGEITSLSAPLKMPQPATQIMSFWSIPPKPIIESINLLGQDERYEFAKVYPRDTNILVLLVISNYDPSYGTIVEVFKIDPEDPSKLPTKVNWVVRPNPGGGFHIIEIPPDAQVGNYKLRANVGAASSKESEEFFVVFNPKSKNDLEVYTSDASFYTKSEGPNYYAPSNKKDSPEGATNYNCNDLSLPPKEYRGGETVWDLKATEKEVFEAAINMINGNTQACISAESLTRKANGMIRGTWHDPDPQTCDWGNVLKIVQEANSKGKADGQCMDWSGLACGFLRSVGIPTRMTACIPSDGYNLHCWDEVKLAGVWDGLDATPISATYPDGFGPNVRTHQYFYDEMTTNICNPSKKSTALYTSEPGWLWGSERINDTAAYGIASIASAEESKGLGTAQVDGENISIFIEPTKEKFEYGEDVVVNIRLRNDGDVEITAPYKLLVSVASHPEENSSVIHDDIYTDTATITIPAHSEVVRTFTFSREIYKRHGKHPVDVKFNNKWYLGNFEVGCAFELTVSANPDVIKRGDPFVLTVRVKNLLDVPISNIDVWVASYLVPEIDHHVTYTIDTLNPQEVNSRSWEIPSRDGGRMIVYAWYKGVEGTIVQDGVRRETKVDVVGPPLFFIESSTPKEVLLGEWFTISGEISNQGDLPAINTKVTLELPAGLSTTEGLTKELGDLEPYQPQEVSWQVRADRT